VTSITTLPSDLLRDVYLSEKTRQLAGLIRRLFEIGRERGAPTAITEGRSSAEPDVLARRFYSLAESWRRECAHLSSVREMVLHPAYQQIIGMGRDALPFLLRELEREPDHWFWALWSITQENPVRPEHRGYIRAMARDWLEWARRRGIRW
jgi:hypothetical protein